MDGFGQWVKSMADMPIVGRLGGFRVKSPMHPFNSTSHMLARIIFSIHHSQPVTRFHAHMNAHTRRHGHNRPSTNESAPIHAHSKSYDVSCVSCFFCKGRPVNPAISSFCFAGLLPQVYPPEPRHVRPRSPYALPRCAEARERADGVRGVSARVSPSFDSNMTLYKSMPRIRVRVSRRRRKRVWEIRSKLGREVRKSSEKRERESKRKYHCITPLCHLHNRHQTTT